MTYKFNNNLYLHIGVLFIVSLIIIISQNGEVNRDGVFYLEHAYYINNGEWSKSLVFYNWPFFSFLIASVHRLTGLSFQYSAHILNILFFLIASLFYLKIFRFISENKYSYIFPTLILLTSIPLMDDYLPMILRDHGLWAGFMIGIYGYLNWIENPKWKWSLIWQFGFIFGGLFRPECFVFNIFLPFLNQFFFKKLRGLNYFLQSLSIPITLSLTFTLTLLFFKGINFNDVTRLSEIISRPMLFLNTLFDPIDINSENFYINKLINEFDISFKYLFLSYVYFYKWIIGIGFFHIFLFLFAIKKSLIKLTYLKVIVIFFVLSNLIVIINFYATFIITSRYMMINWMIIYLASAIGLANLWYQLNKHNDKKYKFLKTLLIAILVIYILNIIVDKKEQHFEKQLGDWVKQNNINLSDIHFNSRRVAFYSGMATFNPDDFDTATKVKKMTYIIYRYTNLDEIKLIDNYEPIQYFPSENNPKIIVYKRLND